MKARDIVLRLKTQLPLLTDRFTSEVVISSITASGTTATVTTAAAHGLVNGNKAVVAGTNAAVTISTITRVGTVATVVTSIDHDLTNDFVTAVVLSGATEAEFNGTFPLLDVQNRRQFTITVADSGPTSVTGSPVLQEPGLPFGYDGLQTVVNVLNSTSFTYTLTQALTEDAAGTNMRLVTDFRIRAAINADRARAIFTSRDVNSLELGELVLIVVLEDVISSRSRSSLNDGTFDGGISGSSRQQILETVSCIVFQKVTQQSSGATARDNMQDIARFIIKVLKGFSAGSGFATDTGSLVFVTHDLLEYDTAIYSHRVQFELLGEIDTLDLDIVPLNVAFRDISFTITNEQGDEPTITSIDLDEQPL